MMESEGYRFGIATSKKFAILDDQGRELRLVLQLLLKKIFFHIGCLCLWTVLLLATPYFLFFLLLGFLNFFCLIFRLVHFLLDGGARLLYFPPLWEKLTERIESGEDFTLLKQYHLENHPGLLYNLARVEKRRGNLEKAKEALILAQKLAPSCWELLDL